MEQYQPGNRYTEGTIVIHDNKVYKKDADEDNSPPDSVAGGWTEIENTNLAEFQAIADSFNSYEARRDAHKQKVLSQLKAAGLSADEVKAVLNT
jgi:hypothetical protein